MYIYFKQTKQSLSVELLHWASTFNTNKWNSTPCRIHPKELTPAELCPKSLHLSKKLENLLLTSMGFVLSLFFWTKYNQVSSSSFIVQN